MLEKGKQEKHDEQVQFAAYKQFCDGTTVEQERAIKEANEANEAIDRLGVKQYVRRLLFFFIKV